MAASAAAWVVGGLAVGALVAIAGYAIAGSGAEEKKKAPTPQPTPTPKGRWTKVPQQNPGGVPTYAIPANATFAITMTDGTAARVLLAAYNQAGGKFTVYEPGAQLPSDWPQADQEGPTALRGEGVVPFALQIPAGGGVLAVWQWTPELIVGTGPGGAASTPLLVNIPRRH